MKRMLVGSASRSKTTAFMRRYKTTGNVWVKLDLFGNRFGKKFHNFRKPNCYWCVPVFKERFKP